MSDGRPAYCSRSAGCGDTAQDHALNTTLERILDHSKGSKESRWTKMASTKLTAQEVIVFDSSTFIEEAGLTSRGASALKHYLYHRGTQLVVPESAVEEYGRNLIKKAMGKIATIKNDLEWLGRVCNRVSGWNAPTEEQINEHAKSLAKADHLKAIVLPETEALRERAAARNQAERPPSHRRPGLVDCKIWEQCLELLNNHDVVFVAKDGDFRSGRNQVEAKLHPQLRAEAAESAGEGRKLRFHTKMESLLSELKREIPPIPTEQVIAFIYEAIAEDVQELESSSGYRPKRVGQVSQTFLTTNRADTIEVRLEMEDQWENPKDGKTTDFHVSGSCHYQLAERRLRDLKVSVITRLITDPDGSIRTAKGHYLNLEPIFLWGPPPIQPEPEILG